MAEDFTDGTGPKPVSWWYFEEAATPALDGNATNNNDLTWQPNATQSSTHMQGSFSLLTDPGITVRGRGALSTHANLSANFPFKGATSEFTIGGWVYVRQDTGQTEFFLQYSDNNLTTGEGFEFTMAQGKPRIKIYSTGGDVTLTAVSAVPTGPGWVHVVARWNGNNTAGAGANDEISLWVDGVKEVTTGTATTVALNTSGAGLLFNSPSATTQIVFNYDEWFVFDVALLDTQIADIYANRLDGSNVPVPPTAGVFFAGRRMR